MNQIGIMGGTFDPIHHGHLLLGRQAREEYHLQEIWFMPSGQPPHKKDHQVTEAQFRWEMAELALEGQEGFRLSDFELRRPGTTYTAQTLALLHEAYPDTRFYFIIGADSLYEIEQWYRPDLVMAQAVLLVADRDYHQMHPRMERQINRLTEKYGAKIFRLHCPEVNISSVEIRAMAARGESLRGLVPDAVRVYIKEKKLYDRQP